MPPFSPASSRFGHVCCRSVLAATCLLAGGCSGEAPGDAAGEPVPEMATGPQGIRLTDELPRSVPVYRQAVPVSLLDRGEEGVEVGFMVEAEAASVEDWYAGELERNGWEVERQAVQNQGATMIARKGAESLLVLIAGATSGDGPVNILLTYTESPQR